MTFQDASDALEAVRDAGASHLKVEFEAEGASSPEAALLASLAKDVDLNLIVKIGGCEAVRDIRESLQLGVQSVVAPMIESPFAASKFVRAVASEAHAAGMQLPQLAVNIESTAGVSALPEIIRSSAAASISRIVLGRTDLTDSLGLKSTDIDSPTIEGLAREVFTIAKHSGFQTTIGGAVSVRTVPFIRSLHELVDSFETRKVVYQVANAGDLLRSIEAAIRFEVSWLHLKSHQLGPLTPAEERRIEALQTRASVQTSGRE